MRDHAGTVACCILLSMPNKGHVIWLLAALVGASRGADIPEVYRVVTQCERRNPNAREQKGLEGWGGEVEVAPQPGLWPVGN